MREVLDTVSEVQFGSILLVALVVLLAMTATWWFLAGSAPSFLTTASVPQNGASSSSHLDLGTQTRTQPRSDQPNPFEQTEILVRNRSLRQPDEQNYLNHAEPETALDQFAVQIGAFQREDGARRRLTELQEKGYEVRLISYENEGEVAFRLLVGDFGTYDEASRQAAKLKVAGIDAFVRTIG